MQARSPCLLTDPYLLEEDEEAEAKRTPGLAAQEPKEQESELEEEVKEAEEGKEERDEVGDEARSSAEPGVSDVSHSEKLKSQVEQLERSPAEASDVASAVWN
ncbi:unnamed protein product [Durusdinium trenchii]|uniref:Uncharacterized protein n=1 Tax=Durusdinium trenchii TaxID=1381693 RepID=A0ABP0SP98_9DINO